MREIIPSQLWIGGAGDIADTSSLYRAGIVAVVHLASSTLPTTLSRELVYCRIPLIDGSENTPSRLRFVIETCVSLLQNQVPTLIACSAGMSRSPAIAAAALAVSRQKPIEEILPDILKDAPADVSPGLWESVTSVVGEIQSEAR